MAEITEYRISDLTAAASLNDSDSLEISQEDAGELTGHISKRTTMLMIANRIATIAQYTSSLQTTSKTLTGAINELKQLISLIPQFSIEVVQTLPTEDISETTIYLVPNSDPEQGNYYEEYIYVNNTWELVGTTAVDLSAYYTKLEVDGLLAAKANTSDVTAALALKEAKADMNDDVTDIVVDLTDTQETAEGNPVTLQTVQEGYAKAVTIKLTPKQDLHGYDKPWPGGGGKNKFPYLSSETQYGVTITVGDDGTITLNGTCTESYNFSINGTIEAGSYSLCDFAEGQWPSTSVRAQVYGEDVIGLSINNPDPSGTVRNATSASGGSVTFRVRIVSGFTYNNNKLKPMLVKEAVSTMTYEPYANICPIEGYEEASATRTGVNQWDEEWEVGSIDSANGLNVQDNTRYRAKNYIRLIEGSNYYFKFNGTDIIGLRFYDANKNYIGYFALSSLQNALLERGTNRLPANAVYLRFVNITTNTYNNNISINYPATDTDYHAYDGATATAEFPETIYGATGDAAGGDWGKTFPKIDLGTLTWTYNSMYSIFTAYVNPPAKQNASCMCDRYEYSSLSVGATRPDRTINVGLQYFSSSFNVVSVKDTSYTSAADFKAAMSGVEFSYELAAPVPFQTAPAPLTLRKGDNTITTDGDSVKVKYNKLALPDIGGIGRYISALEARVKALES